MVKRLDYLSLMEELKKVITKKQTIAFAI